MDAPDQDLRDRRPIWDELQIFWMDTDPMIFLKSAAQACARSKYSLSEVEQIFWNEVRPAVRFNMMSLLGEWAGFEIAGLSQRILETNRFSKKLPVKYLHPHSGYWWSRLCTEIEQLRDEGIRVP